MKKISLLLALGLVVFLGACKKKEAGPVGKSYVGVWVDSTEPRYIEIKEDNTVNDCHGTSPDLMSGVGMKFESGAALNPRDGSLIYKFVWMGDHLMINGKTFVRGELSPECQNLLSLP